MIEKMDESTIYDSCSKIGKKYSVPIHTIFNKPVADENDKIISAIAVEFPKLLEDESIEKICKEINELMAMNNCQFIRTEKDVKYSKMYYYEEKSHYVYYRLLFTTND